MITRPDILFLDWHNTLSTSLFWDHLYAEDIGTYTSIQNWLFAPDQKELVISWMRGQKNCDEIIDRLSNALSFPSKMLDQELIKSCQSARFIDPDIPHHIQRIRQNNIRVILASDNMDVFRRYTVPALELEELFDDILMSNELGALKDDISNDMRPFFQAYQGVLANACLLDDSVADGTCRLSGLRHIKATSPEMVLSFLKRYNV